jgi:hypothetical protein
MDSSEPDTIPDTNNGIRRGDSREKLSKSSYNNSSAEAVVLSRRRRRIGKCNKM